MDAHSCLNCKARFLPGEPKLFERLLICDTCHFIAMRSVARIDQQLAQLRVLALEAIRLAVIEGKLAMPDARTHQQDVPKKELLEALLTTMAKEDATEPTRRSL